MTRPPLPWPTAFDPAPAGIVEGGHVESDVEGGQVDSAPAATGGEASIRHPRSDEGWPPVAPAASRGGPLMSRMCQCVTYVGGASAGEGPQREAASALAAPPPAPFFSACSQGVGQDSASARAIIRVVSGWRLSCAPAVDRVPNALQPVHVHGGEMLSPLHTGDDSFSL